MWQPHAPNARHEPRGENANTVGAGGVNITTSSTINTKGSWIDVGAVTSFAYEAITVCLFQATTAEDFLVDIGISDGSNRFVLCADLYLPGKRLTGEIAVTVYIPVHVPAGAQLSARSANSTGAANDVDLTIVGHASGVGGVPGFSRCVTLFTPASSRGIAVDPGGSANTKGTWAQLTASCPEDIGAMFGLIGYNGDTTRAAQATALIDIGIGAGGSEFVLYPNALVGWGATRDGPSNCPRIPVFACNVPKTTRIAARAACNITTAGDRTVDLALYGLVL